MRRIELLKEQLEFLLKNGGNEDEIKELEDKIKRSKKGRSSKTKGASYERTLIKLFTEAFPDGEFARTPMSGGFHKKASKESLRGDLSCLNEGKEFLLHIEAKNHKTLHINDWWKQATEDCPDGKIPTLCIHRGQEIKDGVRTLASEDFILLRLKDFLSIVDKPKVMLDKSL